MAAKTSRVRKWTTKTRTGCRTCRFRRIKCDETRPECNKCSLSGRECGGYEIPMKAADETALHVLLPRAATNNAIDSSIVLLTALPSKLGDVEMRSFDYFRRKATESLSGHFSSSTFQYLIPQLSHREPVVLQAAVAVGSVYQSRLMTTWASLVGIQRCPMYQQALAQYGKAMSQLWKYIESSKNSDLGEKVTVVLTTCLLFICFEMLGGDQGTVLSHLMTGLKMLYERSQAKLSPDNCKRLLDIRDSSSDSIDQLSQVFVRLDADSTMFGRRAPYLCPRSFGKFLGPELDLPTRLESVEEARAHLDTLTSIAFGFRGEMLKLVEDTVPVLDNNSPDWPRHYCILHAKLRRLDIGADSQLSEKLTTLLSAFNAWSLSLNTLDQNVKRQALLMIRIQYFYPWFTVATLFDVRACDCDRFQDVFCHTIDLVSEYITATRCKGEFSFGLEPGLTASLYLLGIKCRDPTIRREAISFLRKSSIQEGMWKGRIFASYCQKFMVLEEERAKQLLGLDDPLTYVPEEARFGDVVFGLDPSTPDVLRLICARYAFEKDGSLEVLEERIKLLT